MTREEAIEILEANRPDPCYQMLREAVDFAVDALKSQGTCEDAVSRQTLQKELALYPIDDVTSEDEAGYNRAINDVQKMVLHLPSIQPKSEERTAESAQNVTKEDLISRKAAIDAVKGLPTWWADAGGYYGGAQPPMTALLDPEDTVAAIDNLPSAQPNLDRAKISDLLEKIYSIQSVHLTVEGVLARKYYCKQLWIELFGSEDVPKWID